MSGFVGLGRKKEDKMGNSRSELIVRPSAGGGGKKVPTKEVWKKGKN